MEKEKEMEVEKEMEMGLEKGPVAARPPASLVDTRLTRMHVSGVGPRMMFSGFLCDCAADSCDVPSRRRRW